MIAALWFFHGHDAYETARAQAISVTVGGVLQLGWLMLACRQVGVRLAIKRPRIDDDVRQLLKLILPAAVGAGAVQVNLAVSTALAGGLLDPGSISYIYYADRLNQLPLGLIGIGLGTILLPTISRQLSQDRGAEAMQTQNRGIELALFLTLPATIAFIFASEPIIRGLFQHGRFTEIDSIRCSWALSAFSLGLPSYVLVKVLTPGYYARHDTKTPVRYAIQSVGINLVGNILFIPLFGRFGFGHVGPPLATAIASSVNVWMLYRTLRKRGHFTADARLRRRVPRLALASILMGAALFWVAPAVDPYLTGSILHRGAGLVALVTAGVVVYSVACFLTGAFVLDDLKLLTRRAREA
jgi:putative peptidoglycan lipid II flippase